MLRPGDQIAVRGYCLGLIKFYHHGIFISHEEGVIEFGGDDKSGATVKRVGLLKFTNNRKRDLIRERYRLPSMCFQPNVVVKNAKLLLKNPQHLPPYNLMLFNCEHFATYCKTGILKSNQCGFLWKYGTKLYEYINQRFSKQWKCWHCS